MLSRASVADSRDNRVGEHLRMVTAHGTSGQIVRRSWQPDRRVKMASETIVTLPVSMSVYITLHA